MVRRLHRDRVPLRDRTERVEELREVPHLRRQRRRPRRPLGGVSEQPLVLLHRRAAPGRVDDDYVDTSRLERLDGPLCEPGALGGPPGVQRQRPAAPLCARDDHVAPLGGEDPCRRRVDPGIEHRLHAAGEHADDGPPLSAGRHPLGESPRRHRPGGRRGEPQRLLGCGGDPPEQARPRDEPVRPGPLQQRAAARSPPAAAPGRGIARRSSRPVVSRSRSGRRASGTAARRGAYGPAGRRQLIGLRTLQIQRNRDGRPPRSTPAPPR